MAQTARKTKSVNTETVVESGTAVIKAPIDVITQTKDELIKVHGNKSNAIRALDARGFSRSQIATALEIRYQHVRNVLLQPLKREIKKERDQANQALQTAQPE